jgi:histidine ammonia-lyase
MQLLLDGRSLRLDDLLPLARGERVTLAVAPSALERVRAAREIVDRHVERRDVVYGLTTGFGKLKNVSIALEDLGTLQRNLILSHCCGVGEPMPLPEVRVAQVLRLNGLLRGHSGVRTELIAKLVRLFDAELVPLVPQQGSVGASGDLAPLAHMTAAYMGHGEAYVRGERMSASRALAAVGSAARARREGGLALINGTEIMKAVGALSRCAPRISRAADAILALTIEALLGASSPSTRVSPTSQQRGQRRTAAKARMPRSSEVLPSPRYWTRRTYSRCCAGPRGVQDRAGARASWKRRSTP